MTRPAPRPGDVVGRYRLGPALGAGGAGAVFQTWGSQGETLAIKLVVASGDPGMQARARREVDALARLSHPSVLGLIDWGLDGDQAFLVTPLIGGATLRALLVDGPLLPETAALLIGFAAAGAGAIHAAGLVHRDLKPDNVMITDDGRVVVIDLGLALAPDWTRQTVEGTVAGSLPYMAPEQIEGDASPASDVWALGVTMWELIVGQRPFARARAQEEVAAILGGVRPPFTEADRRAAPELAALIERCLGPRAQRPADGATLARELEPLVLPALGAAADVAVRAVRADRAGWESALRPRMAQRAARRALELASAGDPFAAMRAIDRGMAYAPDEPAVSQALAQVLSCPVPAAGPVASGGAGVVAVPTVQPVRRRRRWPWVVAGGGAVIATGVIAALLSMKPASSASTYKLDQSDPQKVFEAVIRAAQTGEIDDLPKLCYPEQGDGDVRHICDIQKGSRDWMAFVDTFAEASITGSRLTGNGAVVWVRLGRGRSDEEEIEMLRVGRYYYLAQF